MVEIGDKLSEELEALRRTRDELRVKIHLGRAEARERFEQLEKSWHHLEGKLKLVRREAKEPLHEIGEAARELLREIRDGYRQIRNLL
jgi:hypothetical protein